MSEKTSGSDGMLVKAVENGGLALLASANPLVARGLADVSAAIDTADDLAKIALSSDELEKLRARSPLRQRLIAKLTHDLALSKLNSHLRQKGLPELKSLSQIKPLTSLDVAALKSLGIQSNIESEAESQPEGPSNE